MFDEDGLLDDQDVEQELDAEDYDELEDEEETLEELHIDEDGHVRPRRERRKPLEDEEDE
jgi:hypothetical protein